MVSPLVRARFGRDKSTLPQLFRAHLAETKLRQKVVHMYAHDALPFPRIRHSSSRHLRFMAINRFYGFSQTGRDMFNVLEKLTSGLDAELLKLKFRQL